MLDIIKPDMYFSTGIFYKSETYVEADFFFLTHYIINKAVILERNMIFQGKKKYLERGINRIFLINIKYTYNILLKINNKFKFSIRALQIWGRT